MNRFTFGKSVFLLGILLLVAPLYGQMDRATISGTVTDSTGAVLPGVDVNATNVATGVLTTAVTNGVGIYTLLNIPIGTYSIRFALPGFKTYERTDYTVVTAQAARLNVMLEVGEVTESITVAANSELLNSDNSTVSTLMQFEAASELPLAFSDDGRMMETFAYAIVPGVEGNHWTSHISGGAAFTEEVLVDGISATAHIQGHIGESYPSMEAVQEFAVQTSGMSAEYGHTSGGVFQYVLKSGTNDIHGSALFYGRNEALNANTWMNNWNLSQHPGDDRFKRPRSRENLFGGSAGGPIVIPGLYDGRDRTFIYGAFEHFEQENLATGEFDRTVPIPAFLDGDFSRLLSDELVGTDVLGRPVYSGAIYDPASLRQVEGQWVADPFDGNIIPSDRISGVSRNIADIFRQSYRPQLPDALTNNMAQPPVKPWFHQTQLSFKGDHAFSESNKLSGSFVWTQRPRILVDSDGLWDPLDNVGGPLARSRKQEVTSRRIALANNWTLQPNIVNTLNLAYNRYRNPSLSTQADGDWANQIGLGGSTSAGHFPDIQFGDAINGIDTTRIGFDSSGYYVANTYILSDSLGWITGRHTLKFGGEVWHQELNSHSGSDVLSFGFSPLTTAIPGEDFTNRIGFGFASFLLGDVVDASKGVPFDQYGRRNYVAFYVNDDFKTSPRLTLNLGLRWEQPQPLTEKYGRWANFSPDVINTDYGVLGALEFPQDPGQSFEGDVNWTHFAPRLGFAYRVSDKVVLRGGYGIFYSPPGLQHWSGVPYGFAPGFQGTNQYLRGNSFVKFNWDDGYPDNFVPGDLDPNTIIEGMVNFNPETSLKSGYTHQYNASLQFSLDADTMVEAAFIGNQGRRLHNPALRRNQPTREAWEDPNVKPQEWIWDEASAEAAGVPYPYPGFSGFAGQALMPYPHVGLSWWPIWYQGTALGESSYQSLQFTVTRRMSRGIAANFAYNYSKTKGNSENGFQTNWDETGGIQDVYNLAEAADTVVSFDQTHIFKGYANFELPFGKNRRWLSAAPGLIDAILGGWDITAILRYNSGDPLSISPDVWYPGWTLWGGGVYADVAPNATFDTSFDPGTFNPGVQNDPGNRYFNPSDFSNPEGNSLGNGKRYYDELRGFGYANEDIGIMKYWSLGERASLNFRLEVLNVFNRHHFADPGNRIANANTFGLVTSTTGLGRLMQYGLRLEW